jgi:1-acyl-sn-glycerol-3-phosphate acyltransferase
LTSRLIQGSWWAPRPWMKGLISTDLRTQVTPILSNWSGPIVDLYISVSHPAKKSNRRSYNTYKRTKFIIFLLN